MYQWLETAIESGGSIVTANHRLARELRKHYGRLMAARGQKAWRTPRISELTVWLQQLSQLSDSDHPLLIEQAHSHILWERVLKHELGETDANFSRLAKDAAKSRDRLAEYQVPIAEVGDYAYSDDQRLFAAALNRYLQLLSRHAWIDQAAMPEQVMAAIRKGLVELPTDLWLAGVVKVSPVLSALLKACEAAGCKVHTVGPAERPTIHASRFIDDGQELRAAGGWARALIDNNALARVGIVVPNLEEHVLEVGQEIREGFCPGWQLQSARTERLVNVSYGRRMLEYPAIQIAMLCLRWITGTLTAIDISVLLRSACIGAHLDSSRIACELALRDVPNREWTIDEFANEYARDDGELSTLLHDLQASAGLIGAERSSPAVFAGQFNAALEQLGWPGSAPLGSSEFQLVNRWRESLNQLSALSLVEAGLSARSAVARLNSMLSETIFQPEAADQGIDVLGPLEAAGIEFDALWITGMSAERWPGNRRPDPLIARELQLKYAMPDADPDSVRKASEDLFAALSSASGDMVLSFGQFDGDAERSPSPMLPTTATAASFHVPGLFAESMCSANAVNRAVEDPVPPVDQGERVFGGASIIDRQATSPFDAFALSRLGIQPLWPFSFAFSARDRGILVHEALARFYATGLGAPDLRSWTDTDVRERATAACRKAFQGAFRGKSSVQANILRLEEERMTGLLVKVWRFDCERQTDFEIVQLEERQSLAIETLKVHLQADRIDQLPDASVFVLDYKTGSEKRLLSNGELNSFQLVLYAMASQSAVSGIALYNVNTNGIKMHGAGAELSKKTDLFADSFERWQTIALAHASNIVRGDVRVLAQQPIRDSRRTGLLSRVRELQRDA